METYPLDPQIFPKAKRNILISIPLVFGFLAALSYFGRFHPTEEILGTGGRWLVFGLYALGLLIFYISSYRGFIGFEGDFELRINEGELTCLEGDEIQFTMTKDDIEEARQIPGGGVTFLMKEDVPKVFLSNPENQAALVAFIEKITPVGDVDDSIPIRPRASLGAGIFLAVIFLLALGLAMSSKAWIIIPGGIIVLLFIRGVVSSVLASAAPGGKVRIIVIGMAFALPILTKIMFTLHYLWWLSL